jgi:hypothetical protein
MTYAQAILPSALAGEPARFAAVVDLIFGRGDETPAEMLARLRHVTFGMTEPLRRASSDPEFRAAFKVVARPELFAELAEIFRSPAATLLYRRIMAVELRPAPPPRNLQASELLEDLVERLALLVGDDSASVSPPEPPRPDVFELVAAIDDEVTVALAGALVALTGLSAAAYSGDQWDPWQLNLLWTLGERAALDTARGMGLSADEAHARMTTTSDRALLARGVDPEESDEALRLLGLQ